MTVNNDDIDGERQILKYGKIFRKITTNSPQTPSSSRCTYINQMSEVDFREIGNLVENDNTI